MSTVLVWFRQDLRLADNPALLIAARNAKCVIPVYVWHPADDGKWPPGAASRWWLHESLQQLQSSLMTKNSRLILRTGPTIETLLQLTHETGATQIYWNRRHEPAAAAIEAALQRSLQTEGIEGIGCSSALLSEPGAVISKSGTPYQVFTPFWRAFLEQTEPGAPQASPQSIPAPSRWPESLALEQLQLLPQRQWFHSLAKHWQPGEAQARATLKHFVTTAHSAYAEQRDRPDLQGTSRLSPHLHFGEVSPRQVWHAGLRQPGWREGKFCAELIWREFAAQQLHLHPTLADQPRDARFERIAWQDNATHFHAWTRGQTGEPMVDAGMRELWQTGWMHNRARMITASYLVKNLLHRWQEGERWFWDTLVDADLASNALNWQWISGTSPDAAPWFRIFNPQTQAEKFDPQGAYRKLHVPEAGSAGYSSPIVDLKQSRQQALDAFAALRSKE
jgi:deoxyribodipyrimidine photo-lyase